MSGAGSEKAEEPVAYKAGDSVSIWSNTDKAWCSGTVKLVEGGNITVEYFRTTESGATKSVKVLPAGDANLKPATADAQKAAVTSQIGQPLEKRTDFGRICLGAALLSAISGMVNAVAIIEMSSTVAHHTGNASHFGRLFGSDGARFLGLMAAYLVGAGTAGFKEFDGNAVFCDKSSEGLLGVAGAIATGAGLQGIFGLKSLALLSLSFSQGLQNGITSRFSGLALRTTHMTGALTDAGLILGQWVQAQYLGKEPPSLRKPKLFLLCLLSFAAGGFVANLLRKVLGTLAALVPAALLAVVASGRFTITEIEEVLLKNVAMIKAKVA